MFLDVTSRMVGDVMVVDLAGELSRRASSLSNPIKDLLADDRPHLILNLSALSYVDSSGLGTVTMLWKDTASLRSKSSLIPIVDSRIGREFASRRQIAYLRLARFTGKHSVARGTASSSRRHFCPELVRAATGALNGHVSILKAMVRRKRTR